MKLFIKIVRILALLICVILLLLSSNLLGGIPGNIGKFFGETAEYFALHSFAVNTVIVTLMGVAFALGLLPSDWDAKRLTEQLTEAKTEQRKEFSELQSQVSSLSSSLQDTQKLASAAAVRVEAEASILDTKIKAAAAEINSEFSLYNLSAYKATRKLYRIAERYNAIDFENYDENLAKEIKKILEYRFPLK